MDRQKQQHPLRRRTPSASTPSWLLLVAAAATIPTLLHAFAPNMAAHNSKRPIMHHQSLNLQTQQVQPSSSSLMSKQMSFLGRTSSSITSMSKLFAGPKDPSASLEEDDDDEIFDEDNADDDEGKQL